MNTTQPATKAPHELEERVISIDRVSRTVKGGKRMRFRALVVVGDRNGRVGTGIGKANEVPVAVAKATVSAKKHLVTVHRRSASIAHAVEAKYGSTLVQLWPASEGTSIIAGSSVRAVVELSGIRNILGKLHGSTNKTNAVRATLNALTQLQRSEIRDQRSENGSPKLEEGNEETERGKLPSDLRHPASNIRPPTSEATEGAQ